MTVHSDQGCQYTSCDWQTMLDAHDLKASMSRKGNCHDNACAESFFGLLKRERIKRKIYRTREDGKADVFNYIELFYNSNRPHGYANGMSPMDYVKDYFRKLESL